MKRDGLTISINSNDVFDMSGNLSDKIIFKRIDGKYHLINNEPYTIDKKSRGLGILDIYLNRLKIVLPSEFKSLDEEKYLNNAAEAFSKPVCEVRDPRVRVSYPILTDSQISDTDLRECNLVILDSKGNNKLLVRMKDKLPIRFDQNGYEYNQHWVEGDYCLEFISTNPLNEAKQVMIVSANTHSLLSRNMFLKKISLPIYLNGLHPVLNNEVIIYDGFEYKVAFKMGDELKKPYTLTCLPLPPGYL
jgi:hypothetical protein